jgi:uncharacterized protein YndB with AHSA1/START domain
VGNPAIYRRFRDKAALVLHVISARRLQLEVPDLGDTRAGRALVGHRSREEVQLIDFVIERDIARSPAEVFAYVVDATKLATWQRNTVSAVPDGPMGLGTKIREVHRAPGGKQMATVVEVVEYEPDRAFGLRIIEGPPVHGQITFEPSDTGTRFRFRVYSQPTGLMRIAQPIITAMLRRQFDQHCTNLKTVLEAPPSP